MRVVSNYSGNFAQYCKIIFFSLSVLLAGCGGGSGAEPQNPELLAASGQADIVLQQEQSYLINYRGLTEDGALDWNHPELVYQDSGATIYVARDWLVLEDAVGYEIEIINMDDSSVRRLTFESDSLCNEVICQVSTTSLPDITNTAPSAVLNETEFEGTVPFTVNLDAKAATDPDGDVVSFQWNVMGRYVSDNGSAQFNYTFEEAGFYNITVDVSDGKGGFTTNSAYVTVTENTQSIPAFGAASAASETVNVGSVGLSEAETNESTPAENTNVPAAPLALVTAAAPVQTETPAPVLVITEPDPQPEPEPAPEPTPEPVVHPVAPVIVDTSDWPTNANGDLPLAGLFYGNPATGEGLSNSKLAVESSRRFRAQRSGGVTSVRFHNRVLSDRDIEKKCSAQGSSSQWCKCQSAGLDARSCGYAIGNSYSVGNGGRIAVELRPDDGNGLPSNQVLGKTSSYVPLEEYEKTDSHYITLDFANTVDVQIGGVYHLVFTNSNPPSSCKLAGLTISQAGSCPRNQGAIALNGIYDRSIPTTTGRWGPIQGDKGAANLYRSTSDNSWQEFDKGVAFYEIYYTDGVAVGESYHALDAMTAGEKVIGGSKLVRQRFTVEDSSREVDGVWVSFGHSSGADGSALSVVLKDAGGDSLAKGTIAASKYCVAEKNPKCRDWGYTEFGKTVSLLEGSEYTLEISASAAAKVRLSTFQTLLYQGFKDRNDWTNAWAEYSSNNGSSWNEFISYKGDVRDMAVLFTIEGMPRKLP